MSDNEPLARLASILRSEIAIPELVRARAKPYAIGWATVELERAVTELGAALRIPGSRFGDAVGSSSLGARCLVASGVLERGASLALLEPNTEGRLAATLARHDEGPAAVWLAVDNLAETVVTLRRAGRLTSREQTGPFGLELLLDGPIHGPHRLLVERPGTIRA